jgi:hypothetical protein
MNKKSTKRSAVVLGVIAAVAALTLLTAVPANAATLVGTYRTTNFGTTEFNGTMSYYYAKFSSHADKGWDYATSAVHIKHVQATSGTTYYGSYAAPGTWSLDNLDYAYVVKVGDNAYV